MNWEILHFGKYNGKSLPQIILADPDWFFYGYSEGYFENKGAALKEQAILINSRVRKIKIPGNEKGNLEVEYLIHRPTNKFSHFDIEDITTPVHKGGSPAFRSPYIDLSVPRQIATYDKSGGSRMIAGIKFHVFGSPKTRLTKVVCEDFFSNPNNFAD